MDIRIVNTCNSNCLYCLEQPLRTETPFIDTHSILEILDNSKDREILSFYGGNPLLHPELHDIISYARSIGYASCSLLTNSHGITNESISSLQKSGLDSCSVYFHSFDQRIHDIVVNGGIDFKQLLTNILLLIQANMLGKVIIHVNALNIKNLGRDICMLKNKFGIDTIDFINYFPFDRPYEKYKKVLEYDYEENREQINNLFQSIITYEVKVRFLKFPKLFFGIFTKYYDYKNTIISQIGEEDIQRLSGESDPFCLKEKRCPHCFIIDNCKFIDAR